MTNDASCAALAESRVGAGRGVDDLIMITLGTGIGGGVIAEGASSSVPMATSASSAT